MHWNRRVWLIFPLDVEYPTPFSISSTAIRNVRMFSKLRPQWRDADLCQGRFTGFFYRVFSEIGRRCCGGGHGFVFVFLPVEDAGRRRRLARAFAPPRPAPFRPINAEGNRKAAPSRDPVVSSFPFHLLFLLVPNLARVYLIFTKFTQFYRVVQDLTRFQSVV